MLATPNKKATTYLLCLPSSSSPRATAFLFGLSSSLQPGGDDVMVVLLLSSERMWN